MKRMLAISPLVLALATPVLADNGDTADGPVGTGTDTGAEDRTDTPQDEVRQDAETRAEQNRRRLESQRQEGRDRVKPRPGMAEDSDQVPTQRRGTQGASGDARDAATRSGGDIDESGQGPGSGPEDVDEDQRERDKPWNKFW